MFVTRKMTHDPNAKVFFIRDFQNTVAISLRTKFSRFNEDKLSVSV